MHVSCLQRVQSSSDASATQRYHCLCPLVKLCFAIAQTLFRTFPIFRILAKTRQELVALTSTPMPEIPSSEQNAKDGPSVRAAP